MVCSDGNSFMAIRDVRMNMDEYLRVNMTIGQSLRTRRNE